eukprot:TRINITY_DN1167_c0_g1_i6.p1 TRINITY_DN1167_c0_g1~~TRINITY_DN1167_c0_g1_i6.p1  ORF type:complete len:515 (-),score=28.96 TRINITY_DN1167_c0_g1_i6:192-1643(-)
MSNTTYKLTLTEQLHQQWYVTVYSFQKWLSRKEQLQTLSYPQLGQHAIELCMDGGFKKEEMTFFAQPKIQDFSTFITRTEKINFKEFFANNGNSIYPYCVDPSSKTLILVKTNGKPQDYNTMYLGLNETLTNVYAVLLKEVSDLMINSQDLSPLLFLYKVGRCGSTLFTTLLQNAVADCEAHSEPFVFTQLLSLLAEESIDDDECVTYLRAVCWIFVQGAQARSENKEKKPLVVLAPQGAGKMAKLLLSKAIPEAKAIFMYRDPIQVIDSFLSGVFKFIPQLKTLRDYGISPWLNPLTTGPAFQVQSNYKKPQIVAVQEQSRTLMYYNEVFLRDLAGPEQIDDYAIKQFYYQQIGVNVMHAYGTLYTMQRLHEEGLLGCSILYDDFIVDIKRTFIRIGEVLDLQEYLCDDNIDDDVIKNMSEKNIHFTFQSGRNGDYKNYVHFEGKNVQSITEREIEWANSILEKFKQLTGLKDYIIDGTIIL